MTQSFDAMKEEIQRVAEEDGGWATNQVSGASATLSQDGYAQVAILANNREMAEFVRRVVSDLGLSVEDEGGLHGLAQWHSGDKMVQTFGELQAELINASKTNSSWVVKSQPCPGTGHPSDHELDEIMENSTKAAESTDSSKLPGGKSGKHEASTTKQKPDRQMAHKGAKEKSHGNSTEESAPVSENSDSKVDEGTSEETANLDPDDITDEISEEDE